MELTLGDIKIGNKGKITKIKRGAKEYKQKLIAMGVLPGAKFVVTNIAPVGDPIEIEIRGYSLSLRKDEAKIVYIEKL